MKALVGVTSVAVLAVGSARIGLLPQPGSQQVTPVVPRVHVPAVGQVSQQFVPKGRRASASHVAAKGRPVGAPVAATPTAGSGHPAVPEQDALPLEAPPAVVDVPSVGEPTGSGSTPAPDPTVADTPAPTADPGQNGDTHGPNENAAAGQAQRDDAASGNANPTPGTPPLPQRVRQGGE